MPEQDVAAAAASGAVEALALLGFSCLGLAALLGFACFTFGALLLGALLGFSCLTFGALLLGALLGFSRLTFGTGPASPLAGLFVLRSGLGSRSGIAPDSALSEELIFSAVLCADARRGRDTEAGGIVYTQETRGKRILEVVRSMTH